MFAVLREIYCDFDFEEPGNELRDSLAGAV